MQQGHLTVGELRKKLVDLPDDCPVLYQRIEDWYFKKGHWKPNLTIDDEYDSKDEYIRAFTAFTHKENEKTTLLITAHY